MNLDSAQDSASDAHQLPPFTLMDQAFIFQMTSRFNRMKQEGPDATECEPEGKVDMEKAADVENENHDGHESDRDDQDVLAAWRLSDRRLAYLK